MAFLLRTIESIFYPVGFIWICITIFAIVLWRKKMRGPAKACATFGIFLYLAGATPIPEYLISRLERPYADANVANAPPADVVIVLGGNANASAHDIFQLSLNTSADRIKTGIEVVRQNKATAMILGGGPARIGQDDTSEGQRVEKWLTAWHMTSAQIVGLPVCANTHEEALHSLDIMRMNHWTNALLVTSAYHMPRALATFQKVGIDVHPVACDFEGLSIIEAKGRGFRIVPTIEHLKTLTFYVHEIIGWYYYAARGWI